LKAIWHYYFRKSWKKPMAKPRWIYLSLSHKCNITARLCGVVKILKGYGIARGGGKEDFRRDIRLGRDFTVVITGGEPS
jgi:hypothetical protein